MKNYLLLIGILIACLLLHIAFHRYLFSLFLFPVAASFILSRVQPFPIVLGGIILALLELFSSLPQGSMVLLFCIAYSTTLIWKNVKTDITWKFFSLTLLTICVQIASLTLIARSSWALVPYQVIITGIGSWILAFVAHEHSSTS